MFVLLHRLQKWVCTFCFSNLQDYSQMSKVCFEYNDLRNISCFIDSDVCIFNLSWFVWMQIHDQLSDIYCSNYTESPGGNTKGTITNLIKHYAHTSISWKCHRCSGFRYVMFHRPNYWLVWDGAYRVLRCIVKFKFVIIAIDI